MKIFNSSPATLTILQMLYFSVFLLIPQSLQSPQHFLSLICPLISPITSF